VPSAAPDRSSSLQSSRENGAVAMRRVSFDGSCYQEEKEEEEEEEKEGQLWVYLKMGYTPNIAI